MCGLLIFHSDRIDGLFDQLAHHRSRNGHGIFGCRVGQAGVIARVHGGNLKLCHAARNNCHTFVIQLHRYGAGRHTADHGAKQLCFQNCLAGYLNIALNVGGDAHFHIVAGQRQLEPFGFQVNALQHGDRRAVGDGAGNAVDRSRQQRFVTFKLQCCHLVYNH